jgi:hypothetical protein
MKDRITDWNNGAIANSGDWNLHLPGGAILGNALETLHPSEPVIDDDWKMTRPIRN